MTVPTSSFQVVAFLVLLLPGVVYASVRTSVSGIRSHDREVGARVLQALLVSALLDGVYLLVLGRHVVHAFERTPAQALEHARSVAVGFLVMGVLIPAGLGFVVHGLRWEPVGSRRWQRRPRRVGPYGGAPTAWDFAAPEKGGHWVRIRLGEGKWIAGWIGDDCYLSTYPEPRDIFIEQQHHVTPDGEIKDAVEDTAGVWVSLPAEGAVVEWLSPEPAGPEQPEP